VKKKIAVFANGLNAENLMKFMNGIKDECEEAFADFHVFLGYDSFGNSEDTNKAEWCIYSLPNLKDYDGAIIFGPGLNYEDINLSIVKKCREANIPTISISNHYEGMVRIHTDNYEGMKLIADHLLDVHKIKNALFIAGPKDNEESNDRLRAVKDAFGDRNLPFDESNVFYSNWVAYLSTDFVKNRYFSDEGLPDAIICANDSTAYFICFILEDMGIKCPEEVIVTGFDGDNQAANFYPSITTVEQPFYEMGVKTLECFKAIFAGKSVEEEYYIPCTFRKAESCGCDTTAQYDEYRRQCSVSAYKNSIVSELHLLRIQGLSDAVLKSESYSTIDHYLQEYFYESDGVEGNPYYICMDPEFAKLSEMDVSQLPHFKYGSYFYMLVGKNGENKYDTIKFDTSSGLIPKEENDNINHIFVFQTIYHKTFVCGYMIMADKIDYFGSSKYYFVHVHFNRLLDQFKKNMQLTYLNNKLSLLMNTDALTSIKNRMAFETYKKTITEAIEKDEIKNIAFLVADINNLKYINDNLGHECGDEYIKNAATFLCKFFKHSPVFRMGGDEFFVSINGEDYEKRYEISEFMGNCMLKLAETEKDPVKRISIAFGVAEYDSDIDQSIDDTIKRADDMMYENKRKYKKL